jgi:hypothetical protein
MPNECINKLRVTGPIAERQRLTELWLDDGGEVFNRILPQPRELADEASFEWRCRHWGTRWDVGGQENPADVQERDGETTIVFVTAWDAPLPVIRAMSAVYPSLTFEMVYFEPLNCFAGKARFVSGKGGHYYFEFRAADVKWIIRDLGLEDFFDDEVDDDVDDEILRSGHPRSGERQ